MHQAFKTIKKSPPEVPCFSLARVFRESDLSALCSVYSESRNSRNAIMIQGEDGIIPKITCYIKCHVQVCYPSFWHMRSFSFPLYILLWCFIDL